MRTRLTLRPGQNGTKKLLAQYGDKLVCVRYHYDEASKRRVKTVELIVEEVYWRPAGPMPPHPQEKVWVRVGYGERDMRERVKLCGAVWDPKKRLWAIRWRSVERLGIHARVVDQ